ALDAWEATNDRQNISQQDVACCLSLLTDAGTFSMDAGWQHEWSCCEVMQMSDPDGGWYLHPGCMAWGPPMPPVVDTMSLVSEEWFKLPFVRRQGSVQLN